MAIQTSVIKFTGKLGDVIGYRVKRKHAIRSLPEKVHQTPATKRAARDFGVISRQGKLIRKAIVPYLDMKYDGSLVNRLNRELLLAGKPPQKGPGNKQIWLQQGAFPAPQEDPSAGALQTGRCMGMHQCLHGFAFNPHTGIDKLLTAPPVFSGDGLLQLPAQPFRNTGRATHLEVRAIGVRISFTERRVVNMDEASAVIDLKQPFKGLDLAFSVPGKGTLFVILQLKGCTFSNGQAAPIQDQRYMAADIIAITAPMAGPYRLSGKKRPAHRSSFTRPSTPGRQYYNSHNWQPNYNTGSLHKIDGLPPSPNASPGHDAPLPVHPPQLE